MLVDDGSEGEGQQRDRQGRTGGGCVRESMGRWDEMIEPILGRPMDCERLKSPPPEGPSSKPYWLAIYILYSKQY
jgi:hypothetical protein